ncbi:MAG: uroporphyrinogen-III C-methyltransferase [Planctomycetota bacterium]|nr:uroporphyrinogen-III C-methyltransferase [Planctomycetota bacterium]
MSSLYPLFHKLQDRQVVVIGAGSVALRRIRRLLECGARVTVISPAALGEISTLADEGKLDWKRQPYTEGGITAAELVLTATGDHQVAENARREAQRLGILFNSAEDEGLCDFHVPGLVDAGALKLALSSEGENPALVAAVTRQLEEWLKDQRPAVGGMAKARNEESGSRPTGRVYLVGAGPGDPDLLTVKAARLLQHADLVCHDRLVSEQVLELIPSTAETIYVGKEIGCGREIDPVELMISAAAEGKAVVRLKGGDPVLFGRGAEEMIALAEAGVDYEIVPGVSALCSVAISAGIPVTHRQVASEVVIRSGHAMNADSEDDAVQEPARGTTFVYFMAVNRLAEVVEDLRAEGVEEDTPVAIVENGTLPEERVICSSLSEITGEAATAGISPPALILVGEVVRLREQLAAVLEARV